MESRDSRRYPLTPRQRSVVLHHPDDPAASAGVVSTWAPRDPPYNSDARMAPGMRTSLP